MGKKFLGLGGTDHFWDRAKAWILNQITSAVTAKIAEVVANAPEDLDTLKEIADWISAHADDAAAMNTQITENKNNITANSSSISAINTQITENKNNIAANSSSISAMNTQITENKNNIAANSSSISAMNTQITENKNNITALQTSVAGKADKVHTHTKSQITDFPASLKNPNALTINGKTYDGSSAVNAGVQTVANGGTGATNAADGFNALADGVRDSSTPRDDEKMLLKPTGTWYKTTCLDFWNYIKGKISSVLGLTKDNYGGKADTAVTADYGDRLTAFASWNNPYDYDATNGIRVYVYKITMASYFNSILVQIYDDINYARCRRYVLGLWHVSGFGYSVSVTDLGGTKNSGLKVWMGTDGNIYLQADVFWTSRISFSRLDDITDVTITRIGAAWYGSNADINGNVLFTPLADPITDCGALRADDRLSAALKEPQLLKTDVLYVPSKIVIPIGAPSSLEDGCIWIER